MDPGVNFQVGSQVESLVGSRNGSKKDLGWINPQLGVEFEACFGLNPRGPLLDRRLGFGLDPG